MSVKAFELVPAIERSKLFGERSKTEVQCMENCGKNIYVGTTDGFLVHYLVEERMAPGGRISFTSRKEGHKHIAQKKPVTLIRAASAINKILLLADSTLHILNMINLESAIAGNKLRHITHFCFNQSPSAANPFSVEVCISFKKRLLNIFSVTDEKLIHMKDISTPEPVYNMVLHGNHVVAALSSMYCVMNIEEGTHQELFPYDPDHVIPGITVVGPSEFLLSGPSSLGMFTGLSGVSERPPLQWNDSVINFCSCYPYIVSLNDEFITVHSILDQQQKQTIPFTGGVSLNNYDGKLFVASKKEIYSLAPVAWETQVHALIADGRTSEALALAKNAKKPGMERKEAEKLYCRLQLQAGFVEFSNKEFSVARELFVEGGLDIRELIRLYPGLMSASSNYSSPHPPLHEIGDITLLAGGDSNIIQAYHDFLLDYLLDLRTDDSCEHRKEIDTALLRLCSTNHTAKLYELLEQGMCCDLQENIDILMSNGHDHATAILYRQHNRHADALNILQRIIFGDNATTNGPTFQYLIDYLISVPDDNLVLMYIEKCLDKDEETAVKVLTHRREPLNTEQVLTVLQPYEQAHTSYLEHLVFQQKLKKEKYHTLLAMTYLDTTLNLMKAEGNKQDVYIARSKLRHLLQQSDLYLAQLVLGRARDAGLLPECAILHSKLGEHEEALRILVYELADYGAAENYCVMNSRDQEPAKRRELFHSLLSVYLDPAARSEKPEFLKSALKLLNNDDAEFDPVKVLRMVPDDWHLTTVSRFVQRSTRSCMHSARTGKIEKALARSQNIDTQLKLSAVTNVSVDMPEDRLCAVCRRSFNEPVFVRYPNGVVTHVKCARSKQICPVTGRNFAVSHSS